MWSSITNGQTQTSITSVNLATKRQGERRQTEKIWRKGLDNDKEHNDLEDELCTTEEGGDFIQGNGELC